MAMLFSYLLMGMGLVQGIKDSIKITLDKSDTYYSYMWFGFEQGGTVDQSASVKAPEESNVGFYLCTSKQRDRLKSAFDGEFCEFEDAASGNYLGCDYKYSITQPTFVNKTQAVPTVDQCLPVCSASTCPAEPCNFDSCEVLTCDPSYCVTEHTKQTFNCSKEACLALSFNSSDPCNNSTTPDIINTVSMDILINRTTYYWFVVTNCNQAKVEINVDYVVMNPGGEHLSVGYLEFKYLMNALRIAWSVSLGLWLVSWIISRKREIAVVQVVLVIDASLWTIFSYVETEFWYDYSEEGVPNESLALISYIFYSLAEALFFSLLELSTGGLGICRKGFKSSLKRNAPIIGAVLLVLLWMYKLFGSVIYFIIGGLYMLLLKHYCANISHNCKKLSKQIQLIAQAGIDPVSTPVWTRLRMFRIYRISLLLLLTFLSGSLIAGVFYLELMPWISVCVHLGNLFNCYLIMFFYFRFKRRDPYFDKVVRLQLSEEGPLVLLEDITQGVVDRANLSPWSHGQPLPYPKNRVVSIVAPLVLVEASDRLDLGVCIASEGVLIAEDAEDTDRPERAKLYEVEDSVISAGDVDLELSSADEVVDLRLAQGRLEE